MDNSPNGASHRPAARANSRTTTDAPTASTPATAKGIQSPRSPGPPRPPISTSVTCAALGTSTTPTATIEYAIVRLSPVPIEANASSPTIAVAASMITGTARHPSVAVLIATTAMPAAGTAASSSRLRSRRWRRGSAGRPRSVQASR